MTFDSAWYHSIAGGISDIYWQELNRAPDEGGWIEWFVHVREGNKDLEWIRARIRESEEWAYVHRPKPALPRLVVHGQFFQQENGVRFTAVECSDFNLFGRYLNGEDIRPILEQRRGIGFNMLRVWGAYEGNAQFTQDIGRLVVGDYPNYYAELQLFLGLCAEYQLYVEFVAFTGQAIPHHWENLALILPDFTNVIVELENEHGAHPSSIDPRAYSPIPGVLCSHGSNGSEATPVRPAWDYETFHTNDAFEWWRKGGHNGMELYTGAEGLAGAGRPVLANENTRPDRDGNVSHHRDASAACALLIAGSCHHSQAGKSSRLFTDAELIYAAAHVEGCRLVDLNYQDGRYFREDPGADLRVYSKINPDNTRFTVRIGR